MIPRLPLKAENLNEIWIAPRTPQAIPAGTPAITAPGISASVGQVVRDIGVTDHPPVPEAIMPRLQLVANPR